MGEKENKQNQKQDTTTKEEMDQQQETEVKDEQVEMDNPENDATEKNEQLITEIEQLKQEKDDVFQRLLRMQAEYDNFKKRTQKERVAERKYQVQDLATELLPVLDNFERALDVEATDEVKGFLDGMSMIYRQLIDVLKSQGVTEIETVGKEFNPNIHHAVMQVEHQELPSNTIVEVLQKGYMLKDKVIRPAMVKVNK